MINDNIKQILNLDENKINNIISNYEIYKFDKLNQNQISKLYDIETENIFSEANSKKHLTKIFDMIKSEFNNLKTNNYLNLFFKPTNNINKYNFNKNIILNILNINFPEELSGVIKNLENLKTKIYFSKPLYTLDESTKNFLYDNYKLNSFLISKKELEQLTTNTENLEDFILITDDEIYNSEFEIYKLSVFKKIIIGNILANNKKIIEDIIQLKTLNLDELKKLEFVINQITKNNNDDNNNDKKNQISLEIDFEKLEKNLQNNTKDNIKKLSEKLISLEVITQNINLKLKDIIKQKSLNLTGDEILDVINSGNVGNLQTKFNNELNDIISLEEKKIIGEFLELGIKQDFIFENNSYPLKISDETIYEIENKIKEKSSEFEIIYYKNLGEFNFKTIKNLLNSYYFIDLFSGIKKFVNKYNLNYPIISQTLELNNARNIYIKNASPINYGLNTDKFNLNSEKISVLTGANSGGKTTMLEMFLQIQILSSIGFPISSDLNSKTTLFDEIIYLKKFTGNLGSGAFEQTIRNLIEILNKDNKKLILIDEFEAITEPGSAAKILIQFLQELANGDNFCVAVSHLGSEIQKFLNKNEINNIRIDGISAVGLDEKGNLITNHQPTFY